MLHAALGVCVPAALLLLPATGPAQAPAAAPPGTASGATPGAGTLGLLITGMQYIASSEGHNEWVVSAASARLLPDGERAELEQVHARIGAAAPGGAAGGGLTLRCDTGFFDLSARDFRAEGNVRGETLDGRRIDTERLAYDASRQRVFGDAPVVIEDDSGQLQGTGFEYFVREDRFQLREARVSRERP